MAALALAELVARGSLALAGAALARVAGPEASSAAVAALGLSMVVVGALEGACVGVAQLWALNLKGRLARRFVAATVAAFALAWLGAVSMTGLEPTAPGVELVFFYAAGAGAVLGALAGCAQSLALGGFDGAWTLSSALGWSAGMVVGALVSRAVPEGPFTAGVLGLELLSGVLTGLVVGFALAPAARTLLATVERGGEA